MQTSPTCIPCILTQVLNTARRVTSDEWLRRRVLVEAMELLQKGDFDRSPAEVVHDVVAKALAVLGNPDPYADERAKAKEAALAMEARARESIRAAQDPLLAAAKIAAAANAWDAVVLGGLDPAACVEKALERPFAVDEYASFKETVGAAGSILYVLDNAGEVVFDRLLIEQLAGKRVACVARRSVIYNDVTPAEVSGLLPPGVEVIDPGADLLGLPLNLCSRELRQRYSASDVVIAKGPANYETLEVAEGKVFFLMMVKCARVAEHLRLKVGDAVLAKNTPKAATQRTVKQSTRVLLRKGGTS